jgi:acetyl esterase/lipase
VHPRWPARFAPTSRVTLAVVAVLALAGPLLAAGCVPKPPASCAGTGTTAHRDLRYASSPSVAARHQSLDLYVPKRPPGCGPAPLVVYVHGGGFVTGDKANKLEHKVPLFNGEGWAFASINYRLVDAAGAGPTNGEYPAAEQDVAAAIDYLHDHARAYDVDARRTMLLGHSAGAFLVALVSTDGGFLSGAGRSLDDVVCTAPIDTTYDIPAQIAAGGTEEAMFRNAFGDDPAVWERASPPNNVAAGKGIPAFHVLTRGQPDRVAQSQAFGDTLRAAGVPATVQVTRGLTHEDVNARIGQPGDTVVTPALMAFFRGCIASPV